MEWPRPVYDGSWTDRQGVTWRMRRSELDDKRLRRLLKRSDLRVLHAYQMKVSLVEGAEREALLQRVHDFHAGLAPEFSDFELADFRDPDRNPMLVIQESC